MVEKRQTAPSTLKSCYYSRHDNDVAMVTVIGVPINNVANGVRWGYRQMREKLKSDGRRREKYEGKNLVRKKGE